MLIGWGSLIFATGWPFYAERSGDETLRPATRIRRLAADGRGFAATPPA